MQAGVVEWDPERHRSRRLLTVLLCAAAIAGAAVNPALGLVPAAILALFAALDWRVPMAGVVGALIAALLLIPSGLRIGGGLPFDVTPDRVMLLLLLAVWLCRLFELPAEPLPDDARTAASVLVGLLGVAVVSVLLNGIQPAEKWDRASELRGMLVLLAYVGTYFLAVSAIRGHRAVERLCAVGVVAGAGAAVTAIAERFLHANPVRTFLLALPGIDERSPEAMAALVRGSGIRVFGTGEHPIAFGGAMAMLLPLALYLVFVDRKHRLLWVLMSALIGTAMLFTVSRSALIACAVGFLVLLVTWRRRRVTLIAAAAVGLLAVHLLVPGLLGTFRATLQPAYLANQESLENNNNRASDYPRVAGMIPQRVLFGLGFNVFDPETYFYLDNQLLKLVLELGVVGTGVFFAFVYLTIRSLVRTLRSGTGGDTPLAGALLAAVASFCVLSLFFDSFGFVQTTYLFFILSAFAMHVAPPRAVTAGQHDPVRVEVAV